MRVLLSGPRGRKNQGGAVVIVVALMAIVIFGLAAFTVDFGLAYVSKRQLQTASDAGALAAASVYTERSGDCATLVADPAARADAQTAADKLRQDNRPGSTGSALVVECNKGKLDVTYQSEGDTDVIFGGVLGFGDTEITTGRKATATVDVPAQTVIGLRPYMVCSNDVPGGTFPSPVMKVGFPATPTPSGPCPTGSTPGNWWTINCPEGTNNSTSELADKTRNGCDDPVSIVAGQPSPLPAPDPNTPLRNHLLNACVGAPDEDCLSGVPGNISGAEVWSAWASLLGKKIILPVFCGEGTCKPAAVVQAGGENALYPVHKFIGVTVCGYHWGAGSQKTGQVSTGLCANNPSAWNATDGGESANYLLLAYSQVQTSGTTGASTCALGDPTCDGGLRRVLLTR